MRLKICQDFDQWASGRPVHFLSVITSLLRVADDTELDWFVVRENSEGEYAGLGSRPTWRPRAPWSTPLSAKFVLQPEDLSVVVASNPVGGAGRGHCTPPLPTVH
ncbi:hypothetical protein ABZS83_30000 [Streptomyces sp. NPDC005426]|uniref:hypothetical protein n=1 Tax=Streptomyces sp. NPDC005426 TaxID=3155344 RepID=UPI0033AFA135